VLLSDSLEAAKMFVGYADKRVTVAEPPAEQVAKPPAMKKTETPVNQEGVSQPSPNNFHPPASLQEVNNGGVVGLSSPPSGCLNGFSQSRNWPVGFDYNGEIVAWEEEEGDYWDGLPLNWTMDGDFGEEAMAIRDAIEEEFQLIAR